jgi:hypothetical protein
MWKEGEQAVGEMRWYIIQPDNGLTTFPKNAAENGEPQLQSKSRLKTEDLDSRN